LNKKGGYCLPLDLALFSKKTAFIIKFPKKIYFIFVAHNPDDLANEFSLTITFFIK